MSSNTEVSREEEEEMIDYLAKKIHQAGMDVPAIILFEGSKPIVWIGGEMSRVFITPFIPIISEKWGIKAEKFVNVFEKRENVEKLLKKLENLNQKSK